MKLLGALFIGAVFGATEELRIETDIKLKLIDGTKFEVWR